MAITASNWTISFLLQTMELIQNAFDTSVKRSLLQEGLSVPIGLIYYSLVEASAYAKN